MKGRKSAGRSALITSLNAADRYRRAADQLLASGHVYRDYSTDSERAADKNAAQREKRAYRFRRKELSAQEAAQFEAEGRPFALRFAGPPGTNARPPRPDQGRRRVFDRRDRRFRDRPS